MTQEFKMTKTRGKLREWGEWLGKPKLLMRTMPGSTVEQQIRELRTLVQGTQAAKPEGPTPSLAETQWTEWAEEIWAIRVTDAVLSLPDSLIRLLMTLYPPGAREARGEPHAADILGMDRRDLRHQRGIAEASVSIQIHGRLM